MRPNGSFATDHDRRANRGGVLLAALIFVAVIALTLTSYLTLSHSTATISHRSVYLTAAYDLAETGLEHGLWSLNQANTGNAAAWDGWTTSGSTATRKFDGFAYSGNVTGYVKVLVENYNGSPPTVVARSVIQLADGSEVEKWLRIGITTRTLFSYGLLARETIVASGGAWFDSWISDPDNDPTTPAVPWSSGVALDNSRMATVSGALPSVSIGSSDVYGVVSVGAGSSAGLAMSWGGQVGPRGMAISGPYNVAPGALATNFTAAFEDVEPPTGGTVRVPYILPRSVSGPPWYLSSETMGAPGVATSYQLNSLKVEGAATLTIEGDVTLYLPPDSIETIRVAASGKIVLASDATLTIYTPGDIDISGAGITNPAAPVALQIWSTRNGVSGQSIRLTGSGALNALIYAPDADLTLPGSTDFAGSAIVKSATLTGSGAYHYDESLKNFGSGGSLKISSYSELNSPVDRAPYAAIGGP
ncbi:DUF7305 domain-containing protein [Synoicihabitans lomoniglobus]|uniref:DUF7305 domain-containing protein n=1 Tax=Synoicihabitans lomoniglobus TaxID=2909285 RepID=A0AAF0CII5_9BACT|nr:hypothetical protein [Opitutaceae bacterium LMO-M01]WED65447.1 hypothetical protein PXH66_01115 [Opitutaceae bacterium LMO-M01]